MITKWKSLLTVFLILTQTGIVGAAGVPEKHPTDLFSIGKPSSSSPKKLMWDWNLGSSTNPFLGTDSSLNLNYNYNNFQLGDGTNGTDKIFTANTGAGSPPQIKFNHSTSLWQFTNDGSTFNSFGSGSSVLAPNYILNADAESGTTGWSTFGNTAANIPTTGTGGSAVGLTFSRSTSSPLAGTGSFLITQANTTSLQGKGVSYDFTIDPAQKATPLSVVFNFNADTNFTASDGITAPLNDGTTTTNAGNSDIEVFLYDKTNAQLIYATPQVVAAKGSNNFTYKGTFQTASNSTSYRVIFFCATTHAPATGYNFKFDNVYVGPQTLVQGSVITDPVAYTPVFTGWGTVTGVNMTSRRIGGSLELTGSFTSGIPAGGTPARMTLGYGGASGNVNVESTILTQNAIVGSVASSNTGLTAVITPIVNAGVSGQNYLQFGQQDLGNGIAPANGSTIAATGDVISVHAIIPISGWSSSVQMSNDTASTVVALAASRSTTQNITNSTATGIIYDSVSRDTSGQYNSSTGVFTVGVSGLYKVTANDMMIPGGVWTAGQLAELRGYKNGSIYTYMNRWMAQVTTGAGYQVGLSGSMLVPCTAGDTLAVYEYQNQGSTATTGNSTPSSTNLTIERISGPSTIAADAKVFLQYTGNAGTVLTANVTDIDFANKVVDSHSAWTGTVFKAPRPSFYLIEGMIHPTSPTNQQVEIYVNGTVSRSIGGNGATSNNFTVFASGIYLNAGDLLSLRSDTGCTLSNTNGSKYSWISISSQ